MPTDTDAIWKGLLLAFALSLPVWVAVVWWLV